MESGNQGDCQPLKDTRRETGHTQAAAFHCGRLLGGIWRKLSADDIRTTSLGDGAALSNYIYLCEIPEPLPLEGDEPRQAVVRFYGEVIKEDTEGVLQNSVIFSVLSGLKLGPQLYGLFDGGRVEEYLPSRCLAKAEMRLPSVATKVATLLAKYHTLAMPICKKPTWLYETIEKFLPRALQRVNTITDNIAHNRYLERMKQMDLPKEYEEVKLIAAREPSPVVFCHNDLNRGNILLLEETGEMRFIDFDYCSYNHRGFDIATFFNESCNYRNPETFPQYLAEYPSKERQLEFFTTYLSSGGMIDGPELVEEVQAMSREVDVWGLIAHFFWALWALNTAGRCTINFPFIEFAMCRLQSYFKRKGELLV